MTSVLDIGDSSNPADGENEVEDLISGAFITGVEIDVDQWRAQTIEELQGWLDNIKNKTTSMGDPLVDFPEGWDAEKVISQKKQFDMISEGIARDLKGPEAKEAMAELKSIRAQAEKIRQLDKVLSQLEDDEDDVTPELPPEDENLLNTEIVVPNIDTSGPNPFELDAATAARLKEIDEKLGITGKDDEAAPTKTMDQINDELMKLYSNQTTDEKEPAGSSQIPDPKPTKSPSPTKALGSRPKPAKMLKK